MDNLKKQLFFLLVVSALDIFCNIEGLAQQNPWGNRNNAPAPPLSTVDSSSTTPWPELGQRKPRPTAKPALNAHDSIQNPKPNLPPKPSNIDLTSLSYPTGAKQIAGQTQNSQTASLGSLSYASTLNNKQKPQQVISNQQPSASSTVIPPTSSNKNSGPDSYSGILKIPTSTLPSSVIPPVGSNVNKNPGSLSYASAVQNNKGSALNPIPPPISTNAQKLNDPKTSSTGLTQDHSTASSTIAPVISSVTEDDELREFAETLLRKDTNNAASLVTVNFQGRTTSSSKEDQAPLPLLTYNSAIHSHPTISKFIPLHNNYVLDSTENEHVTPQEKLEENGLLDAILVTPVFQHTRNFLVQKDKIAKDPKLFRDLMKTIWFTMYSRGGGRIGSSGFEHVFLAEVKNGAISGLHNWLYFHDEESKRNANYLGYMKKFDLNNKGAIVKYHFTLNGIDKPVGSMFIGTSPELEMALYTTCFLMRPNSPCPMKLAGNRFVIRTFSYRYRGKDMIGSAFPDI